MTDREYKILIKQAGYLPTKELVAAVKKELEKLATTDLIDGIFKTLRRQPKTNPTGKNATESPKDKSGSDKKDH